MNINVFQIVFVLCLTALNGVGQVYHASSLSEVFENKATIKTLNLTGKSLEVLPNLVSELINLEELNLSKTNLKTLPIELSLCKKLRKIDLGYNPDMDVNQVFKVLRLMDLTSVVIEGCQLSFVPFQLAEIRTLNYLNASNNLITELPDNFGKLTGLISLNVAMNQLDSIQTGINRLPNLKSLDISFNSNVIIDHLITSSIDFPVLEEVKLVGVKNFPKTLNLRNKSLTKLDLSSTSFKNLNQLSTDSFKVDYVIAKNCKKLDYDFACKTLQNSGVKKLELADSKMENLPKGIHKMKALEELTVEDSKINYVPSLNNHKKLERIIIESENLNTIYSSVSRLDNLKYLNIKETKVKHDEVEKLVEHFPHAEIVYNPQKVGKPFTFPEYLKDLNYNVPFENLLKAFEQFKVFGNQNSKVELESGTTLEIEAGSLVKEDGTLYSGEVSLKVREYKNSLDIYLSGLPMVYDSTQVYGFESGGMYQIEALTMSGEKLNVTKGKSMVLNTDLPDDNKGFQTYTLNNGTWRNNGNSTTYYREYTAAPASIFWDVNGSRVPKKPVLVHDGFAIEYWKTKDIKGYQLKFLGADFGRMRPEGLVNSVVSNNPLSAFANDKWIVIDSLASQKLEMLKKEQSITKKDAFTPFSSENPKILFNEIQEIRLDPQYEKDNFLLTVITKNIVFQIEIIQDFSKMGPKSSKRRLKSEWKRYNKTISKMKGHNERVKLDFENNMIIYQKAMQKIYNDSVFQADNPQQYAALQQSRANYQAYKNNIMNAVVSSGKFRINSTGTCNIDRLMSDLMVQRNEVYFQSYSTNGDSLELDHVSILATDLPTALKYVGNKVFINSRVKSIAIAKTKDGRIAFISKSKMKKAISSKDKIARFEFEVLDPEEVSVEEIAKKLIL